jgi:hypothetical protein
MAVSRERADSGSRKMAWYSCAHSSSAAPQKDFVIFFPCASTSVADQAPEYFRHQNRSDIFLGIEGLHFLPSIRPRLSCPKIFSTESSASDDVDRVAPAGWYMLLLVNAAGVPSMAQSIHLS